MTTPLLELAALTLAYDRVTVLANLQLSIHKGRWVALVGANASGKTTLLRCIAGRHAPAGGSVHIDGRPLYPAKPGATHLPGYAVPPEELPPFLTLQQCMDIYAEAHGFAAPPPDGIALAALLGLDAHAGTLVRHASLGTRQKLALVLASMTSSSLLLLDEVFNGLDFASALRLRTHLRSCVDRGQTILLATHSLDVVLRCCDEVVLLDSGRLVRHWQMTDFTGTGALAALENALAAAR